MKEVYVVLLHNFERKSSLLGTFDTEDLANQAIAKYEDRLKYRPFTLTIETIKTQVVQDINDYQP